MKLGLFLSLLLVGQLAFAETIRAKKNKEEMLKRVDEMITKVQDARKALKVEDVITACDKIDELFIIYPEHLKAVGGHMDLFNKKTIKAKNESLSQLIYVHKLKNICQSGERGENLDPKQTDKQMKVMEKSLEKQRKIIKKADTSFENTFYYEYEF